ncbi:phosphoribosyltransferase [Methylophilus sp. 14]|uniref:phosphoribosyltransferase n=1 Tax=Methylophilus sp. 14 TaxID=2781019 RepID=UPI00189067FE|nr:phosphoribosyltransferase [Methylophilus sp. 14]MBF4988531.1 phosphoribosyltransferase [Methylophilus sp. 14]
MLILMTSPDAVLKNNKPDPNIINVLKQLRSDGNPVGIISNHDEPAWFSDLFSDSKVQFIKNTGRQTGDIVAINAEKFKLEASDVLVLATKDVDVQMGKNGGAVLIAAGWSNDKQVASLGIRVDDYMQLSEVIELSKSWLGKWWYSGKSINYTVNALTDLSGMNQAAIQQDLAQRLTQAVKGGGADLNALLSICARSLLKDGTHKIEDLVWGVYPSSSSQNDDNEILSEFTHRLRTTVSRVRNAKAGEPLFIRHSKSHKRSKGEGGDRTDPSNQITTLHLNPYYAENKRLKGKHIILIDDCTTYGVSFGVASAFLKKAGASHVTCIALGKFGNQMRSYEIEINSDPYSPVTKSDFVIKNISLMTGYNDQSAKNKLQQII